MDKLLAFVAEADEEESLIVRFTNAMWSGRALQLQLAIKVFDSAPKIWEVRCEDVLAYMLCRENAFSLELTQDHPLLWEYEHERSSAYFHGAPISPDAAVGALYEAHQNAVGSW